MGMMMMLMTTAVRTPTPGSMLDLKMSTTMLLSSRKGHILCLNDNKGFKERQALSELNIISCGQTVLSIVIASRLEAQKEWAVRIIND